VFRAGFTLEAAERLAGEDALDGVASLLDKAFLRRDPAGRFAMLETIREYGLECLIESGRYAEVRLAHARLMADIAQEHERDIDHFALDADNFRTALESAIEAGEPELALRLAAPLWWFWYLRGLYSEGRRWLERVLAMPGAAELPIRAKAMTGAGALAFLQCHYDEATKLLDAAIEFSGRHGDPMSLAHSLQFRGSIARERAEYGRAIELHELSRRLWQELGHGDSAGRSLNSIAFASWLNRDFARTFELAESTLQLFRERRDIEGVAWSLLNLAAALFYSGQLDAAAGRLDECLTWSRGAGFKEGVAWSLHLSALVLRARGEPHTATVLQESLRIHWELGDRWRTASLLEALGGVRRDPRLLGAAAALRRELATPVPPVERPQLEADAAEVGVRECTVEEAIRIALG
jgi:predicted ATPase